MTILNPYLNFDGNAREAMGFYQEIFGGALDIQTFADYGAPVSDGYKDKVMHARLDADDLVIMASDAQEGSTPVVGDNISLSLSSGPSGRDRLVHAFNALVDGGTTAMPLSEAPWGATFGMLTDKYGINWLINIDNAEA